jgi:flagellar motor component MotA
MADDLDINAAPEAVEEEETSSGGGKLVISHILGKAMAFGGLVVGLLIEGSSIGRYVGSVSISPGTIVFGGTFGATITSVGLATFLDARFSFMRALKYQTMDRPKSIGTLVGFAEKARREGLLVLSNITDASRLAASISVAFIATLYGVSSANLIFLPIGNKLKHCATDEVAGKEMLIEGILAIQSGDNPRIVEEKLVAFLSTKDRVAYRAAKDEAENALEMDLAA